MDRESNLLKKYELARCFICGSIHKEADCKIFKMGNETIFLCPKCKKAIAFQEPEVIINEIQNS
jgi:hypothetical protein